MTVPSKPKLSDVISEFGGPNNLRAYYRGGSYVPNTSANSSISTSPSSLKLSQFSGAKKTSPLSAGISGNTNASCTTPKFNIPCTAIANLTAVPSGGSGSYSYKWSVSKPGYQLSSTTAKSVNVSHSGTQGAFGDVSVTLKVTDSAGATDTVTTILSFTHN